MMERLKGFPFALIFFAYVVYLGYQYYVYNYGGEGRVEQNKAQIAALQTEVDGLRKKLAEGEKFKKSLDLKRDEMRAQLKKLSDFQGALAEALDVPAMIKLLFTEAKKAELKVDKIEPGQKNQKEYYLEQEFKIDMRGTYQNLVLFCQRVAQLQQILRIEAYSLKPSLASSSSKNNMISAQLSVRGYQYTMTKEDRMIGGGQKK